MKSHIELGNVTNEQSQKPRLAVGYVRVSADMQAADGLSLYA
jgi:hypothetical protein